MVTETKSVVMVSLAAVVAAACSTGGDEHRGSDGSTFSATEDTSGSDEAAPADTDTAVEGDFETDSTDEESSSEESTTSSEESTTRANETTDEVPCESECVHGSCDPQLGECECEVGYQGPTCEEVYPDCKSLLEATPDAPSGVYTLQPDGSEPFEGYCEMEVDGGGWLVVFKNHGGVIGGELANLDLLSNPPAPFTGAIGPHTQELKSGVNVDAWSYYKNLPGLEWVKWGTLWDANDIQAAEATIRVIFGQVTWDWILGLPAGSWCNTAPSPMSVIYNGEHYLGQTDQVLLYGYMGIVDKSYGLASSVVPDLCDQPSSNLIHDPEGVLYSGGGELRHLFSYIHDQADTNASRCTFMCWQEDNTFYDGHSWMVRPMD